MMTAIFADHSKAPNLFVHYFHTIALLTQQKYTRLTRRYNQFIIGTRDAKNQIYRVLYIATLLNNNKETDIMNLQISVEIFNEDITARSEYAIYNRESLILELSGSANCVLKR